MNIIHGQLCLQNRGEGIWKAYELHTVMLLGSLHHAVRPYRLTPTTSVYSLRGAEFAHVYIFITHVAAVANV
jgi:hypothetical protein